MTNQLTRQVNYHHGSYSIAIPKDVMIANGWKEKDNLSFDIGIDGTRLAKNNGHTVYSIGYEGKTIDVFLDQLTKKNIKQVIDVRDNAISRKNGFSKKAFKAALESKDIQYVNLREMGAPKDIRQYLKETGNFKEFIKKYSKHFRQNKNTFSQLLSLCNERTSALVCFEAKFYECHRQVIASELGKNYFSVIHL